MDSMTMWFSNRAMTKMNGRQRVMGPGRAAFDDVCSASYVLLGSRSHLPIRCQYLPSTRRDKLCGSKMTMRSHCYKIVRLGNISSWTECRWLFSRLLIDVFWCLHYFLFVKRGWYVRRRKVKCKAYRERPGSPRIVVGRDMRAREVKNPAFVVVKRQLFKTGTKKIKHMKWNFICVWFWSTMTANICSESMAGLIF